uniref:Uncharacterized protein n=1 Tax=Oryza nivara TaxID=4536 RepID=A0A0E0IAC8_ORYNI
MMVSSLDFKLLKNRSIFCQELHELDLEAGRQVCVEMIICTLIEIFQPAESYPELTDRRAST